MKIIIVRHGEASFDAPSDHQRVLTERGIAQNQNVAEQLKAWIQTLELSSPPKLWASTLVRAQQSAQTYSKILGADIETQPFLGPDSDPDRVIRALSKLTEHDTLVMVSHQPLVGTLVSLLEAGHPYEAYPYSTSEALCLQCELPERGLSERLARWSPTVN